MTPQLISFVKALAVSVLVAIGAFLSDPSHLVGLLPAGMAGIVAALASALETSLKQNTGNTVGLFGAVRVK